MNEFHGNEHVSQHNTTAVALSLSQSISWFIPNAHSNPNPTPLTHSSSPPSSGPTDAAGGFGALCQLCAVSAAQWGKAAANSTKVENANAKAKHLVENFNIIFRWISVKVQATEDSHELMLLCQWCHLTLANWVIQGSAGHSSRVQWLI